MNEPFANDLAEARFRLPQHVVHRSFVSETVVLNLKTGKYHGLNTTAGKMLDALHEGLTVAETAQRLAAEYEQDAAAIQADVTVLCRGLVDRGLMEAVGGARS